MKKLISTILILALAASTFAACGTDDGQKPAVTTASSADVTTAADTEAQGEHAFSVPEELDYEGATFTVLTCAGENKTNESMHLHLKYDTEDGDTLNDVLVRRNNAVKAYLNIDIQVNTSGGLTDTTAFQKAVRSDDDNVQCGLWLDRCALQLALDGYVIPLQELAETYIDLGAPWWLPDLNSKLTFENKLFIGSSASDMTVYGNLTLLLFNKDMATNLGLDNMYDMVRGGTWTVDVMYDYMKKATNDMNGNSKQDPNDRWGMTWVGNFLNYTMAANNGAYMFEKDENDKPYFAMPGNEKFMRVTEAVANMICDPSYSIGVDAVPSKYANGHPYENVVTMFASGNSLFAGSGTYYLSNLRGMEEEFGILPFPKLEEVEPGTPYSNLLPGFCSYVVPVTNDDPDMASAVLECVSYYAYRDVVPAYLNTVLKLKQARDDDSAEMLQMLADNVTVDIVLLDTIGVTRDARSVFTRDGVGKYASLVASSERAVAEWLDELTEKFAEIG